VSSSGLRCDHGRDGVSDWETSERVLDSGVYESRQRTLVPTPVVEASESGARTLGVTYWQAVDRFTHGGVRPRWNGEGGTLALFGGATLLSFGSPELAFDDDTTSCRYSIDGGLLTLRAAGSVTLEQRPEHDRYELSVTVGGTMPRLPSWAGPFYAAGQSPFHAGVSRRYFELLAQGRLS